MFKPKPKFYQHACDVVAYTYNAEILCPHCTLAALPTGEGQTFDGWRDLSGQPVEDSLTELAAAFGIDRDDESSFDSAEFPKCVFLTMLDGSESCGSCGEEL